jgi:hypothetical protein
MDDIQFQRLCLGIPIDHRLEPLLGARLTTRRPSIGPGGHARAIERYGQRLQQQYGKDRISDNEVKFAKWLAMPETKGGVVIVLLQPAEHQRYFSEMIQKKQPDVVFCCYRSPHSTKYKDFEGVGVGGTRDYPVTVKGQSYTCVNGFHPSMALHYYEDRSELRTLFIIEATQAFVRANDTWRESSWMTDVRKNCAAIVKEHKEGNRLFPILFPSAYKLWRMNANMALVLKMSRTCQTGLGTTFNASDSRIGIWNRYRGCWIL